MSKFLFLFRFSFLDHYNSSSSSLKTTTDNSSSRFNFRDENYTALNLLQGRVGNRFGSTLTIKKTWQLSTKP